VLTFSRGCIEALKFFLLSVGARIFEFRTLVFTGRFAPIILGSVVMHISILLQMPLGRPPKRDLLASPPPPSPFCDFLDPLRFGVAIEVSTSLPTQDLSAYELPRSLGVNLISTVTGAYVI